MRIMKHKTIPEELEEMVHFGPTSSPPIQGALYGLPAYAIVYLTSLNMSRTT